jgi:hypothetical protein
MRIRIPSGNYLFNMVPIRTQQSIFFRIFYCKDTDVPITRFLWFLHLFQLITAINTTLTNSYSIIIAIHHLLSFFVDTFKHSSDLNARDGTYYDISALRHILFINHSSAFLHIFPFSMHKTVHITILLHYYTSLINHSLTFLNIFPIPMHETVHNKILFYYTAVQHIFNILLQHFY